MTFSCGAPVGHLGGLAGRGSSLLTGPLVKGASHPLLSKGRKVKSTGSGEMESTSKFKPTRECTGS